MHNHYQTYFYFKYISTYSSFSSTLSTTIINFAPIIWAYKALVTKEHSPLSTTIKNIFWSLFGYVFEIASHAFKGSDKIAYPVNYWPYGMRPILPKEYGKFPGNINFKSGGATI